MALINLLSEIFGHVFILGSRYRILWSSRMWMELVAACLSMSLSYTCSDDLRLAKAPVRLSVVSLYAWWHLVDDLRAFPLFGERFLPIIWSFRSMGPMSLLTPPWWLRNSDFWRGPSVS